MGRYIPEEKISEVLEANDIVDVISDYVRLQKTGKNYRGLCPFHTEKTPSFTVSPEKGIFYCFGCNAGGNVFSFLIKYENITYPEAVRTLAERAGIHIPHHSSAEAEKAQELRKELYRINQEAAEFYHHLLMKSDAGSGARRYLKERGVGKGMMEKFLLGYAPQGRDLLTRHLLQKGVEGTLLEASGLSRKGEKSPRLYDRFQERIIFPIFDLKGRAVAMGGRTLRDGPGTIGPKYMNSPESPIYKKGDILYGLNAASEMVRREGAVLICEGYLDLIALHQAGFAHSAATCGTALTQSHVNHLKRFADRVIMVFDGDEAGNTAARRGWELLLRAGLKVRMVPLAPGEDPDTFLKSNGPDKFREELLRSVPFVEFAIRKSASQNDLTTLEGRVECVNRVIPILRSVENSIERSEYINLLSRITSISPSVINGEIVKIGRRTGEGSIEKNREARFSPTQAAPDPRERAERELIQVLISHPQHLEEARHLIDPSDFKNRLWQKIYEAMLDMMPERRGIKLSDLLERVEGLATQDELARVMFEVRGYEEDDDLLEIVRSHAKYIKENASESERDVVEDLMNNIRSAEKGWSSQGLSGELSQGLKDFFDAQREKHLPK